MPGDNVDLTVVTMVFDAAEPEALLGILARYVVVSRMHPGCRNIDLLSSVTEPGRFVVVEKWDDPGAQRAHFDSPDMVQMAHACEGLVTRRPEIDLLEAVSAQDLE